MSSRRLPLKADENPYVWTRGHDFSPSARLSSILVEYLQKWIITDVNNSVASLLSLERR